MVGTSERPLLGVMVLGHRRPWLFSAIVEQARRIDPGAVVQIMLDRPTNDVLKAATRSGALVTTIPWAVLDYRENFMETRRRQLDAMRLFNPKYVSIWDDDQLLEKPAEVRGALTSLCDFDLVYATKTYLWDSLETENTRLPVHRSVHFFRLLEGDQFPMDRTINAPVQVHDGARRVYDLQHPLLDIGYLTEAERLRVWKVYKRAGKIDALTKKLLEKPILAPVKTSPVLEQMKEFLK